MLWSSFSEMSCSTLSSICARLFCNFILRGLISACTCSHVAGRISAQKRSLLPSRGLWFRYAPKRAFGATQPPLPQSLDPGHLTLLQDHFILRISGKTSKSEVRGIKLKICINSGVGRVALRVARFSTTPSRSILTAFFPLDLITS